MKPSRVLPLLIALALAGLLPEAADAGVSPVSEVALRVVCSDSGSNQHPKDASLLIVIPSDRFASSETIRLSLAYEPEIFNTGSRGRLIGRPILIRPDGTRSRLGTLAVRQEAPELPALVTRTVKAKVEPGDAILWRVRLREFGELNGRECFQLVATVEPGE